MSAETLQENRKLQQRNRMLAAIRSGKDVSRADIHKQTAYSMTTVLSTIEDLLADRLILEEECSDVRVGRKPTWLRINARAGFFIGVEFNRNWMHCTIVDFAAQPVYTREYRIDSLHETAEDIVGCLLDALHKAVGFVQEQGEKVFGIGLGVPGYNDVNTGMAIAYNHLRGWKNIPVKKIIEEEFRLPCFMGNNVNVMTYAYKWAAGGGTCPDMLFVSVRTGARVTVITGGVPSLGEGGFPGEIGHIHLKGCSRLCECGRYGCLNSEISDVAIIGKIMDGMRMGRFAKLSDMIDDDPDRVTMEVFAEAVLAGDEDSLHLLRQVAKYFGEVLSMLVNVFAPRQVVLYGTLAEMGEPFMTLLRQRMEKETVRENLARLKIEPSGFGRDLGALGAACLVLDQMFAANDGGIG